MGWVNRERAPWVYHYANGWTYVTDGNVSENDIFFWQPSINWAWTTPEIYPWIWHFERSAWYYYDEGSSNPAYYYNVQAGNWESF